MRFFLKVHSEVSFYDEELFAISIKRLYYRLKNNLVQKSLLQIHNVSLIIVYTVISSLLLLLWCLLQVEGQNFPLFSLTGCSSHYTFTEPDLSRLFNFTPHFTSTEIIRFRWASHVTLGVTGSWWTAHKWSPTTTVTSCFSRSTSWRLMEMSTSVLSRFKSIL